MEDDISTLIEKGNIDLSHNEGQAEFNKLSRDLKFDRLNNLIQKTQIYSQIIVDNILQSSLKPNLPTELKKNNDDDSIPAKKKRKAKKQKPDIRSMLSTKISDSTKDTRKEIEASQTSSKIPQPKLITGGTLKDYQLDGLQWLVTLFENGLNGILADEMGLGKTLQCIAFLSFLIEQGITGPFLVVVPLSTLSNWCNEIQKFAPDISYLKYSGSKQERANIDMKSLIKKETMIVITSYEISIRDFSKFSAIRWNYLIVDEGHRLKNSDCLLIRVLKRLDVTNRLLITGTPLQNNLNELWSLLNFILPDIFHDLELFQQWFNFEELTNFESDIQDGEDEETKRLIKSNIQESLIKNLHTILKPFILRRLKRDAIKNLPPKKEYLIHVPLKNLQKKLYVDTLDNRLGPSLIEVYLKEFVFYNYPDVFSNSSDFELIDQYLHEKSKLIPKAKNNVNRSYKEPDSDDEFEENTEPDELKRPSTIEKAHVKTTISTNIKSKEIRKQEILDTLYDQIKKKVNSLSLQNVMMQLRNICNSPYIFYEPFDTFDNNPVQEKKFMSLLLLNSAKFQVLDELCTLLLKENHKILIFSQFTRVLDLLHDWFTYKSVGFSRLDGSTSQPDRDIEIERFKTDIKTKIFLLSTRAGGLGINLTSSDSVILFDNDWNPQMDLQAIDRVHRIGQTKPVKIFRFVVKESVEEVLISKSSSKRFLEKLIIQMGEFKFNKLKKIIEDEDSEKNLRVDIKELIELSRTLRTKEEKGTSGDSESLLLSYDYFLENDKLNESTFFSKKEMDELMDRSEECYKFEDDGEFENISIFETINNMDK